MSRLARGVRDPLAEADAAVRQMAGSPLDCIAQGLNDALEFTSKAKSRGEVNAEELRRVARYVLDIVRSLPKSYGDRFWFDAGLIRAMSDDWSDERLFSAMVIPCYDAQWGYARLPMPLSESGSAPGQNRSHVIELVFLPKADDLAQVALLDYPWIAHELAHCLMFRHDSVLIPLISPIVGAAIQKRRLAGIADRGRARALSQRALDEFSNLWTPTVDHRNWAHEIVADLIAFWVLGPAYLDVFEDLLDDGVQNPYQISLAHPPYALRVAALLKAAGQLRLAEYTRGLDKLCGVWASSGRRAAKNNRYHSVAAPEVIDGVVDGAFRFCERLGLRRSSHDPMAAVDATTSDPGLCELGTDLLTAAWRAFSHLGQEDYPRWESKVVGMIAESLRL